VIVPEPREPVMPPEPVCDMHGLPWSECERRTAAARARFGWIVAWALAAGWAGAAVALVARAFLREPTALLALAAALCGACSGISTALLLRASRAGGARG
jgi:hypothetical protein